MDIRVEISPTGPEEDGPEPAANRRGLRTGVLVGVLALALAGAFVYVRHGETGTTLNGRASTLPSAALDALASDALVIVGVLPQIADHLPGVWSDAVVYAPVEHVFGDDAGAFPAGVYSFIASCSGGGTATLLWEAPTAPADAQRGNITMPCGDGSISGSAVALIEPGEIHVAVHGDEDSAGRAAFAIRFTDPRAVAARAALGPSDQSMVFEADGDTSQSVMHGFVDVSAGRYRLTLVCVGTATIRVVLQTVDDSAQQDLTCEAVGARIELEVGSTSTPADLEVGVGQTDGVPGQAGYAFRVDRVG